MYIRFSIGFLEKKKTQHNDAYLSVNNMSSIRVNGDDISNADDVPISVRVHVDDRPPVL